ncbi:unnamed protein product [Parnassius mnemosyne]|uniref:Endonuclease n=1 Tax=Parnassius mnemosyne TaxID=213953 RepID=A0AAV1KQ59_9NEOP
MPEDKEQIRKRASYKGQITAFSNYLNSLKVSSLAATEVNELQLRISRIESMYERYDEVQLSIECNTDNIDAQISERTDFESLYFKSLSLAKRILADCIKSDDVSSDGGSHSGNHKFVKLPTIQLPKFNGSYDNWLEFHDTFMSLIHSNDEIDDINKFHYLRASLEGPAAVVIQSIEFSAANYTVAWTILCDRYDNKRLLIQNHVTALFNIAPINKELSVNLKRLTDQIYKNLRALESLGEPTKQWDTLLIHIITQKLDAKTYREWEESKGRLEKDTPITFDIFLMFLKNRADLIETLEMSNSGATNRLNSSIKYAPKVRAMVSVRDTGNKNGSAFSAKLCPKCKGDHKLSSCPQFLGLSNDVRLQLLPEYKVCFNCLNSGHYANHCKKPGCKICHRKHNTLVHVADYQSKPITDINTSNTSSGNNKPVMQGHFEQTNSSTGSQLSSNSNAHLSLSAKVGTASCSEQGDVLLSTALIKVIGKNGCPYIARAILDSGSNACLITEELYQRLGLPAQNVNQSVVGINNASAHIKKICKVSIKSLNDNFSSNLHCFVLPSITQNVPTRYVNLSNLKIPSNISLADPNFHSPAPVDMLIGADVFWDLIGTQRLKLGDGQPILCETSLGWLVSGPIDYRYVKKGVNFIKCNFTRIFQDEASKDLDEDIQKQLVRFWHLEEVSPAFLYSNEEKLCEEHFLKNTTRLANGRFCVRIPLKHNPDVLGDSWPRAKKCLLSLERRLAGQSQVYEMYKEFMSEYESLGHMEKCENDNLPRKMHFIPHHGVLRESSTTTKLRVVFNASSPTSSGVSLNNIQMVGPVVQDDLLYILLRFRLHKYVLTADVEKMYRQIVIHPDDRYLQQIVWRDNPSEQLQAYQLNTVTYGTSSAPFLATRCLQQLGLECTDDKVAQVIIHDFYVDDLLTGGDDINEVTDLRRKVTSTLASAHMVLRKWKSNESQLVSENDISPLDLNIGGFEPTKTLGLGWQSHTDQLCFPIGGLFSGRTKRDMLSVISQIFDPLGLLSPCVIKMKMLLQQLWLLKLSWDEQLTPEISKMWAEIIVDLPKLNTLRIPRRVICDSPSLFEFHIFSDASEQAYGACLYVRSVNDQGEVLIQLLMAKSRVAPLKPITIPRLELCGALVGARLYQKVVASLRQQAKRTFFWTDSSIVLGWLKVLPSKLQPFVRNRVAEILEKTGNCEWRHVPTECNPADHISRGVSCKDISSMSKWWSGPEFLKKEVSHWPANFLSINHELPEIKSSNVILHGILHSSNNEDLGGNKLIEFKRFSKYTRLNRTVAYVLRFINNCRKQSVHGPLSNQELQTALNVIIRISQSESFEEYTMLIKNKSLPTKSPLHKFNVFLDDNKIMRVGGRLENSDYCYEKKHPILIQSTHYFTKVLFNYEHIRLMHAGPQLMLATIREMYWPIRGRNLARSCYRQCVRCNRMKGKTISPIMGNLPHQRILSGFPFQNIGLDYAGPIQSVSRHGRGCKIVKVYIAIFICFATKSIHLELVGDLTSNTFILALRRFMSRRGKPLNIYSDNGTSFVGAYNDISKFIRTYCNSLSEVMANEGINFHFIPPYSPHFAGLAEAGVKCIKYHLVRVLGNCNVTYEELNTTLIQIEAILNSRPLTPLSTNPEDLLPLTPGHFLIGRPLTSLPTPDYKDHSVSSLTRFQRIEQLRQHFWARWSKEYISELQLRMKWRSCKGSLKLNSLVLLKEENSPPLKWKMGRIVAVHPGSDGVSRVADIKTSTGIVRRSFSKICPLPEPEESG